MTSYTLFFSPGNREACYLAPERFSSKGKDALELKPTMDIFSLGCVITELFFDGAHLFTLPQLLSYKKNEIDISNKLNQLLDNVKEVIIKMIKVNSLDRWNINQCIEY